MKLEKATFAAGCFWGVQATFDKIKGVVKTSVGYTDGNLKNPSYENVCSGSTEHAESILIEFNPKTISYEKLIKTFWDIHNPTTKDKQGFNFGSQYRSAIFYYNQKQKEIALKSMKEIQKKYKNKIVTEIKKASKFYPAEGDRQKYYLTHPNVC